MRTTAALGIGGTHFHAAVGTADGDLLTDIETEPSRPTELVTQIVTAVERLREQVTERISAVCIACKGLVDHERGVIRKIDVNNGPTVRDVDVRGPIERELGLPVHIENDCTAATLAEYYFGAGAAADTLAHVTIGTGIGGGVIDRGHVIRGEENFAGEVGAIPVGPADGLECFGIPGAWEAYCSGPGILEHTKTRLAAEERETVLRDRDELSPQCLFEAADAGDAFAQECLDDVLRYNAAGFGTIANLYNPGTITVGGGVAQNNREWLQAGIDDYLDRFLVVDRPAISVTEFGDRIGVMGALAQLRHRDVAPAGAPNTS